MADVTFTIEPDGLLGLSALVELAKTAGGGSGSDADVVGKAKADGALNLDH